jgi:hypothetical protein
MDEPLADAGRERLVARFAAGDRARVLTSLAWELSIAMRACYPPPSTPEYERDKPYIGINEAMHRIATRLRGEFGDDSWMPSDEELADYLLALGPGMPEAVDRALDRMAASEARRGATAE